ncbi:unnamed protein product, partial [marine sediment metagenome]
IIVTDPRAKAFLESTYCLNEGIVHQITNYIDVNIFKLNPTDKDIDILYVGRLIDQK